MRNGFLGLRGRRERRAKREIRQELIDLRADNLNINDEDFKAFAINEFESRYDGINVGRLRQILDLILEYLPRILALFASLSPQDQVSTTFTTEDNGYEKNTPCNTCGSSISVHTR